MADKPQIEKKDVPPPPPSSAARAPTGAPVAPVRPAPKRMGFDLTRPFRYGFGFVKGTTTGLLDGMASTGRKGMWAGVAVGLLLCIGGGFSVAFLAGGAAAGLIGGSVLGGTLGGLKGGLGEVNKSRRLEKYADEAAEHQQARKERPVEGTAPPLLRTSRSQINATRRAVDDYNFVRTLQQDNENDRDYNRYWQDREEHRIHGQGLYRGF